jgi:glycosyltransferase involved in cell wall biosynthesis
VWDYAAAQRVDFFVANSRVTAARIAKYYRRESEVVHPPVDVSRFRPADPPGEYFLILARLRPYKRVDLAVEACTRLRVPLHIVGDGPDRARLERMAGPTVPFFGRVSDDQARRQLAGCRALIFPGEEDFGLAPLEAQASGRPVIAYEAGGALETVLDGETGVFFRPHTVEALCAVLEVFEDRFDSSTIRRHASAFDVTSFEEKMYALLAERCLQHQSQFGS